MTKVNKRIYYFRILGAEGKPLDFSADLERISDLLTIGQTEITMIDEVVRIQWRKDSPEGRLYHLAKYTPGSQNSTLTPKAAVHEDEEVGVSPPEGKEFKSGECYMLINGFHVLFCSHGMNHSKAVQYLFRLLNDNGAAVENFNFAAIGNIDKLKLLSEQGVKSIRLNVSAYKLSLPEENLGWFKKTLNPIKKELTALISKDISRSEEKALQDLTVSVEISLEGNSRATSESKETVSDFAKGFIDVIEDEEIVDSFTILTREDTPITGGDVRLHTTVRPEKEGSSISRATIWDGMSKYFKQLDKQNLLEQ
ncbi:hypothetical protein VSO52_19365 [Pseudomonas fulva]|uniref:hypothetical protein n=1 Tax=Pseudomonas fulva TaxID=47880 RepID=UPI002DB67E46|nr:hypothetical protein [Pseudomonas fulva]MEC4024923.1 hypothetical protein [Pseudomonas fulva]